MQVKYAGRCLCGAISYECHAEPLFSGNCHCRDCQRTSGGAFAPAMMFPKSAVQITGTPTYFEARADSGRRIERGFCSTCGSQLFAILEMLPGALGVRAGTLDDASKFRPSMDFWVSSAQHWGAMDPELRKCARAPER